MWAIGALTRIFAKTRVKCNNTVERIKASFNMVFLLYVLMVNNIQTNQTHTDSI